MDSSMGPPLPTSTLSTNRTGALLIPVDASMFTAARDANLSPSSVFSQTSASSTTSEPRATGEARFNTPSRASLRSAIHRLSPRSVLASSRSRSRISSPISSAPLPHFSQTPVTQPQSITQSHEQNASMPGVRDAVTGEPSQVSVKSPVLNNSPPKILPSNVANTKGDSQSRRRKTAHAVMPHRVDPSASTPPYHLGAVPHRQPPQDTNALRSDGMASSSAETDDFPAQFDRLQMSPKGSIVKRVDPKITSPQPSHEVTAQVSLVDTETPSATEAIIDPSAPAAGISVRPTMAHREFINWARLVERTRTMAASINESIRCPWICCTGPGEDN